MKRSFLFILLFFLLICSKASSNDLPVYIPPIHPIAQSTSETSKFITAEVSITDSEITLNFDHSIGLSTLSLTDEYGTLVYQETVNVTSVLFFQIPIDLLENGNYLLTVTNVNGSIYGAFPVEIK